MLKRIKQASTIAFVMASALPAAAQPNALPNGARLHLHHAASVNHAVLSPDGKTMAAAVGTKLTAWDVKSGKPLWSEVLCAPVGPRCLAFAPDGKILAACGDFNALRFFDPRTGTEPMTAKPLDGRNDWWTLAYSPDGKHLVTAGVNNMLGFWDVKTGKQLSQPAYPSRSIIMNLHFSADSSQLAVSIRGDSHIYFWDPVAAKQVGSLRPDLRGIEKAMFAADAKSIIHASPNTDSSINLWDFAAVREVRKFGGNKNGWLMEAFTLSPGGHTLVASRVNDPGVYLFETATGLERGRFMGHTGRMYAMAFDGTGRSLVTAATDNTTIVWDMTGGWHDGAYRAEKLSQAELAKLWNDLSSQNGEAAYRAIWKLALSPEQSVPFLRDRFRLDKAVPVMPDIAKKVALLDHDDFRIREEAHADLKRLLPAAAPALRGALTGKLSAEARSRIESLLGPTITEPTGPSQLHWSRALEAIELAAVPAARELLEDVAKAHRDAWMATEARVALKRWRE